MMEPNTNTAVPAEPEKGCAVARGSGFFRFAHTLSRVMTSRAACLSWLIVTCILTAIDQPIIGAMVFVWGILVLLVFSDDVLTTTLPFLLLCVFVLPNYNSYDLFIPYWWMAIPAAVALVVHFVLYHRPARIGKTFFGVLAVAVAVSAAGLFSGAGYSPTVIFYTISLGVGMVLAYLLIASDLSSPREYDVAEAFSGVMISVGFYATLLLLLLWIRELRLAGFAEMYIQPANNLGTFLLFALPFPLYFVWRAEGRRKLLPAFLFLLFFAALLLSTSRGAMVLAPVLALVSLVLFAIVDEEHRRGWIVSSVVLGVVCVGAAGVALRFLDPDSPGANVFDDLSRLRLIRASMLDFREYPVFGAGLAGSRNTSAYQPVAGAMRWYHMMIPQIIGSMGSVGVLAYGYQIFTRVRAYLSRIGVFSSVLLLSYFGVLFMSQVNPGEFCPLPYELLTVMLFILMERIPQNGKAPSVTSSAENAGRGTEPTL